MIPPPDVWASTRVRSYTSSASLTFLIWENLITLDDEINYIWRRPITAMKKLYLFLRYFTLVNQIGNHFVMHKLLSNYPLTAQACKSWYIYQTVIFLCLSMAVEVGLMIRVYALYNRSRRIGRFLFVVLLTEYIFMSVCLIRMFRIVPEPYDSACRVLSTPHEVMYLGAGAVATQIIIWVMTMIKHTLAARHGWGRTPLVSLMVQDGALVFTSISGLFIGIALYSVLSHSITQIAYSPFISAMSITGCRLTVNIQRLARRDPTDTTSDIELTTLPLEPELVTNCTDL